MNPVMDKLKAGDFGHGVFVIEKKGKTAPIDCYGTIKTIENKFVLFEDNDNFLYLVETSKFEFEKKEFKNLKKL